MGQEFYYFTLDSSTKATAWIYGDIGSGVYAQSFILELVKVEQLGITDIDVRIYSYGGDVYEGFAIFQALKKSKASITTYNDSIAASISSLIFLAGSKAVMSEQSLLMIHNPWTTSSDEKSLEILSLIRQNIVNIIAARSGRDKKTVAKDMDNETWYDAEKAVSLGMATSVEVTESIHQVEAINNLGHIKMYNRVKEQTKLKLSMQNKKDKEVEVVETEAKTVAEAPEVATEALSATPEAEKVHVEVADEAAPNLTVEKAHVEVDTTHKIDITESVQEVLNPDLTPAVTPEITIKEVQETITIQAKLRDLEVSNKRLKEENESIATVNSDLTAKLAAMEVTLNKFKAEETKKAEDAQNLKINNLVESAVKAGKIAPEARNSWAELAKASFGTVEDALEKMYAPKTANKAIDVIRNSANPTEKKVTLRDMEKSNPKEVERLFKEDRIAYNQLYFEAYGKELN
jgi:ATP-dependent Clp protease protease subunit